MENIKAITYADLDVGDLFINNGEVLMKLKAIPPVVPIANKVLRTKATEQDLRDYPEIKEYTY